MEDKKIEGNINQEYIPYLDEILDLYEQGELEMTNTAHKCYKDQIDRHRNIITWVHDSELKNHLLLRNMSMSNHRDLKFKTGKRSKK